MRRGPAEHAATGRELIAMLGMTVLGRYQITQFMTESGMGRLYVARDKVNNRNVVIRFLPEKLSREPQFADMFRREMALLTRLRHPHAACVYEAVATTLYGPCVVSEHVEGRRLNDLLASERRFSPLQVGKWLGQIGSALQCAHGLGILHRDLTPVSIRIVSYRGPDEHAKVMDFGLAQPTLMTLLPLENSSGLMRRGLNTPEYMSPEQARGEEIDRRSDIYSLGIILYELLTGRRPFHGASPAEWIEAHINSPPYSFEQLRILDVPPAIEMVVQRCLYKYVAERPHNADELVKAYEQALGEPIRVDEAALPAQPVSESSLVTLLKSQPYGTIIYPMEAWMMESIAVIKLQGFLNGVGGEILESVPGLVRVRLPRQPAPPPMPTKSGFFGSVGDLVKKGSGVFSKEPRSTFEPALKPVHMKLYMERKDPKQPNLLTMVLLLSLFDGNLIDDPDAQAFCEKMCVDICSYLMAKPVPRGAITGPIRDSRASI